MGCFKLRCTNLYHLKCAQADGAMFFQDKTMLCNQHVQKTGPVEGELSCISVFRRVYVNRDENRQVARYGHVTSYDRKKMQSNSKDFACQCTMDVVINWSYCTVIIIQNFLDHCEHYRIFHPF